MTGQISGPPGWAQGYMFRSHRNFKSAGLERETFLLTLSRLQVGGSCRRSEPPFVVCSWAKEGTTPWVSFLSEPSAPFCWALCSPGLTMKFSIQSSFWLLLNLFTISNMHILDSPIQLLTHLFIHSHILLFTHLFIYSHIHTYLLY